MPLDDTNYVVRGVECAFRLAGRKPPPFAVRIKQRIPVARGLGSSAAALVGGAVAANHLLEEPVDESELLFALVELEGHPEQLAAALYGGLIAVAPPGDTPLVGIGRQTSTFTTLSLPVSEELVVALAVPDIRIETSKARRVLPHEIPFTDAVFNIAAATALTSGLAEADPLLVRIGMRDKLHQDARTHLLPASLDVLAAARDTGAMGAAWSGSGPTMLALCGDQSAAVEVADAMVRAFADNKISAEPAICDIDFDGTALEMLDHEIVLDKREDTAESDVFELEDD
jgi:homoserine kinase